MQSLSELFAKINVDKVLTITPEAFKHFFEQLQQEKTAAFQLMSWQNPARKKWMHEFFLQKLFKKFMVIQRRMQSNRHY